MSDHEGAPMREEFKSSCCSVISSTLREIILWN